MFANSSYPQTVSPTTSIKPEKPITEYAEGKKVGSNLTEFKAAIDLRQIKGPLDSATAFVGASRDGFNITLSEW